MMSAVVVVAAAGVAAGSAAGVDSIGQKDCRCEIEVAYDG